MYDPLMRTRVRQWWLVPVVALVTAVLAYLGSFAFPASYQSSTRLLIRGREATVLSSTGQDLSSQPGVVDSSLAKALAETQAGMANSRTVAEQVVDKLQLDAATSESGVGHAVKGAISGTINRVRAYINHGFYKAPERREQAIEDVSQGLIAKQVGDSYVIELTGTGDTARQAQDITNTAADVLVAMSGERWRAESAAYRDALKTQLDLAWETNRAADRAVTEFKQKNNISDLDATLALNAGGVEQMTTNLRQTEADLSAAQAQLASTKEQLASTSRTKNNSTKIVTGRSSTEVKATTDNSAYLSLLASSQQLQAQVAGLEAKRDSINRAISNSANGALPASDIEAALRQLQTQSEVATDVVRTLNAQYQQSVAEAASGTVELNRLDEAGLSTYPVKPTRSLFLLLGLVFGGLVGFGWSFVRLRRAGYLAYSSDLLDAPPWEEPAEIDLRHDLPRPRQNAHRESVPTANDPTRR